MPHTPMSHSHQLCVVTQASDVVVLDADAVAAEGSVADLRLQSRALTMHVTAAGACAPAACSAVACSSVVACAACA